MIQNLSRDPKKNVANFYFSIFTSPLAEASYMFIKPVLNPEHDGVSKGEGVRLGYSFVGGFPALFYNNVELIHSFLECDNKV